jgi:hypothetical protein
VQEDLPSPLELIAMFVDTCEEACDELNVQDATIKGLNFVVAGLSKTKKVAPLPRTRHC